MRAFETTACADEHGQITVTIPEKPRGALKVIVLFQETADASDPAVRPLEEYRIPGSYYREHPNEPRRTTTEWMAELRAGELDEEP